MVPKVLLRLITKTDERIVEKTKTILKDLYQIREEFNNTNEEFLLC